MTYSSDEAKAYARQIFSQPKPAVVPESATITAIVEERRAAAARRAADAQLREFARKMFTSKATYFVGEL